MCRGETSGTLSLRITRCGLPDCYLRLGDDGELVAETAMPKEIVRDIGVEMIADIYFFELRFLIVSGRKGERRRSEIEWDFARTVEEIFSRYETTPSR
jgi:hypothetical protein